jgi:hypothetical protein
MFECESVVVGAGVRRVVLGAVLLCLTAPAVRAQDRLGGHFGVVFPLVTHVNGETTTIGDDFKIGFPMGITVKTSGPWAFDLEVVPALDPREHEPINVPLTIHPGVLRGLGNSWTAGLRMAFDIGGASWGFTPLLNKGFPMGDHTYFVEFVAPIRFQDDPVGDTHAGITFGVHFGIGF